jgi:hypothetical protein
MQAVPSASVVNELQSAVLESLQSFSPSHLFEVRSEYSRQPQLSPAALHLLSKRSQSMVPQFASSVAATWPPLLSHTEQSEYLVPAAALVYNVQSASVLASLQSFAASHLFVVRSS